MSDSLNYLDINRQSWNKRTGIHLASDFYDNESFLNGRSSLNEIEIALFPELNDKEVLHLQCHFGQDSISLARKGANVTGVDLSDEAIRIAKEQADKLGIDCNFVCCDLYDFPKLNQKTFDFVFTSYGTIAWLPDLDKWAKVISDSLKPGGEFLIVEFHPIVWMFDDDFNEVAYNYFKDGSIVDSEEGTYAQKDDKESFDYVCWNHSLSETYNALQKNGILVTHFSEYDYSPYDCFKGTEEFAPGKFRIQSMGNKMPMVFALKGKKIATEVKHSE